MSITHTHMQEVKRWLGIAALLQNQDSRHIVDKYLTFRKQANVRFHNFAHIRLFILFICARSVTKPSSPLLINWGNAEVQTTLYATYIKCGIFMQQKKIQHNTVMIMHHDVIHENSKLFFHDPLHDYLSFALLVLCCVMNDVIEVIKVIGGFC